MYGFTKSDRSSFPYWFAHWCAYQMVALNCHCWKFKYMFHDWYKPWLRLFMTYDKVQLFHNKHSSHHLLHWFLSPNNKEPDWTSMIIDWECSRYTKNAAQLDAMDEYTRIISELKKRDIDNKTVKLIEKNYGFFYLYTSNYDYKVEIAEIRLKNALKKLSLYRY